MIEVKVVEGNRTYSSLGTSDQALPFLDQARVMDCGYDIRDDLFVSQYWNGSAKLIVKLETPVILNEAPRIGLVDQMYNFTAMATFPDSGHNIWTLYGEDAPWLTMTATSESKCTVQGIPTVLGRYPVSLMVQDGNTKSYLNWTINVGDEPDVTVPVTMISSSGNMSTWNDRDLTIALVSEDQWSGVWWTSYRIDSGPWHTYDVPLLFSEMGWHRLQYRSIDNAGNQESVASVEFGIDYLRPEVEVMTMNGTMFPKGDAKVVQVAWDNTSSLTKMEVMVDDQIVYSGPYIVSVQMPGLASGDREVTVVVHDAAGNEGSDSISIVVGSLPVLARCERNGVPGRLPCGPLEHRPCGPDGNFQEGPEVSVFTRLARARLIKGSSIDYGMAESRSNLKIVIVVAVVAILVLMIAMGGAGL